MEDKDKKKDIAEPKPEDEIMELADEASEIIAEKNKEIAKLKIDLARNKLHSKVEEEEEDAFAFDPSKPLSANATNLEVAEYAVNLYDYEVENDLPLSMGEPAHEVAEFLRKCVDESKNDSAEFLRVYQRSIGNDSPADLMAYKKATKTK